MEYRVSSQYKVVRTKTVTLYRTLLESLEYLPGLTIQTTLEDIPRCFLVGLYTILVIWKIVEYS